MKANAYLIQGNDKASKQLLKKEEQKEQPPVDPRVIYARTKTQDSSEYTENPTECNRQKLHRCNDTLQKVYDTTSDKQLDKLTVEVESAKLLQRKSVKQTIIKTNSREDKIKKPYSHLKELLGKENEVVGEIVKIAPVPKNLGLIDALIHISQEVVN